MTYSVYNIKVDNELSFTPGPTAGYVLGIKADGTTEWIQGGGGGGSGTSGSSGSSGTSGISAGLTWTYLSGPGSITSGTWRYTSYSSEAYSDLFISTTSSNADNVNSILSKVNTSSTITGLDSTGSVVFSRVVTGLTFSVSGFYTFTLASPGLGRNSGDTGPNPNPPINNEAITFIFNIPGLNGTSGSSGTSGTNGANGISAGQTYYFNESQNSDVSGYKVLAVNPSTASQQTLTTNLTGSQQGVMISDYITPQLGFSVIPGGVQRFYTHLLKQASNDSIECYVEIQLADSTGTPIGPTLSSGKTLVGWVDSSTPVEVTVDLTLPTTTIDPTNRMIVRLYLDNNDATAHSVVYYTEGTSYYSFVLTSVGVVGSTSGSSGTSGNNGSSGTSGNSGTSGTSGAGGFTNPYNGPITINGPVNGQVIGLTLSGGFATMSATESNFFTITLNSGLNTINATNIQAGQTINLLLTTAVGNTIAFGSNVKQVRGATYSPSGGIGLTDILTFVSFDSTNLYLVASKNFV